MNNASLDDYNNPFDAIIDYEDALAKYTNAPFVVTTDCCTHAIELCFRYKQYTKTQLNTITIPKRTYLSVPMVFHKLNIPYTLIDHHWRSEYSIFSKFLTPFARLQSLYVNNSTPPGRNKL